jgi:short-subunit dehydrogenase
MQKIALITGASSGIGFELAKLCAQDKYTIIMVAKNEERLKFKSEEIRKAYQVEVITIAKDLANPQAAEDIYNELKNKKIIVDILINNAGFANAGNLADTQLQAEKELLLTNILTLTALTKLFLQDMLKTNTGKILNVASVAAFLPGPYMATYYASKAYVLSLTEAIATEIQGTGVTISCLCPGPTKTGFQERSGLKKSRLFTVKEPMSAKIVAQAGYHGVINGTRVIIPGISNKLMALGAKLTPHALTNKIVQYINQ